MGCMLGGDGQASKARTVENGVSKMVVYCYTNRVRALDGLEKLSLLLTLPVVRPTNFHKLSTLEARLSFNCGVWNTSFREHGGGQCQRGDEGQETCHGGSMRRSRGGREAYLVL